MLLGFTEQISAALLPEYRLLPMTTVGIIGLSVTDSLLLAFGLGFAFGRLLDIKEAAEMHTKLKGVLRDVLDRFPPWRD